MSEATQVTGRVVRTDAKVCHVEIDGRVVTCVPRGKLFEERTEQKNPVAVGDLDGRLPEGTERLVIATGTFPDPDRWSADFSALHPALVDWLGDRGVRLVVIDVPSVDPADSKDLPAHAACFRRGMAIIEGVVLDGVPEGRYELIALPLRIEGGDASPVRAVLRPLG